MFWALPFAGLLLSIALLPLIGPSFWHHHFGKITAAWALALLLPWAWTFGMAAAAHSVVHATLDEYLPFILLLTALYTVAGGIHMRGQWQGSAALNTALLAVGAVLASIMGTTGASMLLVRPLLRANQGRKHQTHVLVFFIFIVANAGGALTPLGDPPLFLGFLKGVDFFWPLNHLLRQTLFLVATLLALFYALDRWYFSAYPPREFDAPCSTGARSQRLGFDGSFNFVLLGAVVGLVLLSGAWKSAPSFTLAGMQIGLPGLVRDVGLVVVTLLSLRLTAPQVHMDNQFSWAPLQEVAKLFAGIFLTIVPVVAMLKAGVDGPFAALLAAVTDPDGKPQPAMYFWITGVLSSFLDNAPTYLVFFNVAGGDAAVLMTSQSLTLAAISAGAVFMGAVTYIGNAPNLMVKAIAEDRGVQMPSFFGYMAWSAAILSPLFTTMTFIWFY